MIKDRYIPLPFLLSFVFLLLRVFKIIDWEWWWLLSPIWISGIASVLVLGVFLAVMVFRR